MEMQNGQRGCVPSRMLGRHARHDGIAGQHVGPHRQGFDDVCGWHGVDLTAQLEQYGLRNHATQWHREAKARERARLVLQLYLAAHVRDGALDDIEAHASAGQRV
jgi:hypothetical protein